MAIINRIKKSFHEGGHTTGSKIRRLRFSKNISAKDLGSACGINDMAVRNYETGQRQPNEDRLRKIASYLDVNYAALVDRKIDSYIDVMHILFEIESDYGIVPYALNEYPFVGVVSKNELLIEAFQRWAEMYKKWESNEVTDEEYFDWKNSFPKVLSAGGNSQKLNDSRNLTLLEQKTLYRQTLTEMKYIVNNYAELITNCAKDKDWVTASMHVEKMKRTMNSIIEVEIKKL